MGFADVAALAWQTTVIAAGGTVSAARLGLVSNMITNLRALNVWTKLDRLWLFAAENSQSALVDLVSQRSASPVSAPTFTANQGYTTSATAYVNTGTPGGPNYIQDSALFGCAKRTNNGANAFSAMGSTNTNGLVKSEISPHWSDTNNYCGINDNDADPGFVAGPADDSGMWLCTRTGSATAVLYRAGVAFQSSVGTTSSGVLNQNFCVGGLFDTTGTFGGGGAMQFSMAVIGGGLTAQNAADFTNVVQAYLTAVGA